MSASTHKQESSQDLFSQHLLTVLRAHPGGISEYELIKALEKDDHIIFQAGTHEKAIRMNMEDYRKLVEPKVLEFSYHM